MHYKLYRLTTFFILIKKYYKYNKYKNVSFNKQKKFAEFKNINKISLSYKIM